MTPTRQRPFTLLEGCTLAVLLLLYGCMLGHFRTFDIDSVWFPSFSWNWWNEGVITDTLMNRQFPHGMGGVEAFGKLAAAPQAWVMKLFGTSLLVLEWLSFLLVAAALLLLADFVRRSGRDGRFNTCFLVILALSEAVVTSAAHPRYEAMVLLLTAAALWSGAQNYVFVAALLGFVSMEVEPAAVIATAGVLIYLLRGAPREKRRRRAGVIALAGVCAAAVYYILHPRFVSTFEHADWSALRLTRTPGGFFVRYFSAYPRHIPLALLLLLACFVAARSRRHLLKQWPALALAAAILLSVALRWDNPNYFSLLMPFLAWFVADALFSEQRWHWIVAVMVVLMLPQYVYRAFVSVRSAPEFTAAEQARINGAIERAAKGDPNALRVVGDAYLWFAHPHGYAALDWHRFHPADYVPSDVVVCSESRFGPPQVAPSTEILCSDLENMPADAEHLQVGRYRLQVVDVRGRRVRVGTPANLREYLLRHGQSGVGVSGEGL